MDEKVNDSLWFENGTGVVMMAHCDAGLFMIPPAIYFFFAFAVFVVEERDGFLRYEVVLTRRPSNFELSVVAKWWSEDARGENHCFGYVFGGSAFECEIRQGEGVWWSGAHVYRAYEHSDWNVDEWMKCAGWLVKRWMDTLGLEELSVADSCYGRFGFGLPERAPLEFSCLY